MCARGLSTASTRPARLSSRCEVEWNGAGRSSTCSGSTTGSSSGSGSDSIGTEGGGAHENLLLGGLRAVACSGLLRPATTKHVVRSSFQYINARLVGSGCLGDGVGVVICSSRRGLRIKQLHICRCQVPVKHVKILSHVLRCARARDSYCATLHKPSYCHLCRRLPVRCRNSVGRGVLEDFPYSEWGVGRDRLSTCAESVSKRNT